MTLYRITPATSVSTDVDAFSETETTTSTLQVDANAFLVSDLSKGAVLSGPADWTANINGLVFGAAGGLSIPDQLGDDAATATINIGKAGSVLSSSAAAVQSGRNTTLTNLGSIVSAQTFAIEFREGTTNSITNSGLIAGSELEDAGIRFSIVSLSAVSNTLTNTGTILGAVAMNARTNSINNSGKISFDPEYGTNNTAIFFGQFADTLTNSGQIDGSVLLGNGKNNVVNSGRISTTIAQNSIVGGSNADAVNNTKTGVLVGAVDLSDGTNKLKNVGKIGSTDAGLSYDGGSGKDTITNSKTGFMAGGIDAGGGTNILNNGGTIIGFYSGGESSDNTIKNLKSGKMGSIILGGGDDDLINDGVTGLVNLGAGKDTLTNTGKIAGFVFLSEGNDILTNTGTIGGEIDLGEGNDTFNGGNSAELVFDGFDADTVNLGGGNDTFRAFGGEGDGTDSVDGGAGRDRYFADLNSPGMRINLDKVAHTNIWTKFVGLAATAANTATNVDGSKTDNIKNFENANGSNQFDVIYGNAGANRINGLGSGDELFGFGGNDILIGGGAENPIGGEDHYYGGAGADSLVGTVGSTDWFFFTAVTDSGTSKTTRDRISNFTDGEDAIFFEGSLKGKFNKMLAPNSQFTGDAGELRTLFTATGYLIEGDINGDKIADFSLAVRDVTHSITFTFVLDQIN